MWTDDFIIRALVAGIGIALVAGPLGCFIVWRKMAYFGDSLAHSALLGIALGLVSGISTNLSTLLVCSLFAVLMVWLQQRKLFSADTLLGILAHGALAGGMIALSLIPNVQFDLHSTLFGDVLSVTQQDLMWIYIGGAIVISLLFRFWDRLVLTTISADLAHAEGVNILHIQFLLMILMTIVVAISMRVVGILMITSLLIIPAATAGLVARSPRLMALFAASFGSIAVIAGISASNVTDIPSGPAIVATATFGFLLTLLFTQLKNIPKLKHGMSD